MKSPSGPTNTDTPPFFAAHSTRRSSNSARIGRAGGSTSAPTKHVVSAASASDSRNDTGASTSGIHRASDWRAASSATRVQRSRFASRSPPAMRTIVRSEMTGTMRLAPSSVAFSIVQSQREPFVTQANRVSGGSAGRSSRDSAPDARSAPPECS